VIKQMRAAHPAHKPFPCIFFASLDAFSGSIGECHVLQAIAPSMYQPTFSAGQQQEIPTGRV
jgi:hypothetical protein